jgi:hypothetical protein
MLQTGNNMKQLTEHHWLPNSVLSMSTICIKLFASYQGFYIKRVWQEPRSAQGGPRLQITMPLNS